MIQGYMCSWHREAFHFIFVLVLGVIVALVGALCLIVFHEWRMIIASWLLTSSALLFGLLRSKSDAFGGSKLPDRMCDLIILSILVAPCSVMLSGTLPPILIQLSAIVIYVVVYMIWWWYR